jgi:L-alanine-DL-glutamate epimerase-like enolase superfamily enzyme
MSSPTRIAHITCRPLDIPLHKPFGIAGGAQVIAHNLLVTVELADGSLGYGEAAPFPAFNGETQASTEEAIAAATPSLLGEDARCFRALAAALCATWPKAGAARCALETAVLDALCRRAGLSLWAFFGGAERALVTDVTIPLAGVDEGREEAARWAREGFSRLKVKIGARSPEEDLARVIAIHEAAPRAGLILDGNGGLSADATLALLEALRAWAIVPILLEQPVPGHDLRGLGELSRRAGVPVAADESVTSAAEALHLAREGLCQVVNIKLMKCGVVEALAIASVAKATGLGLMIGGMVEARLAMGMSACLAAGLGGFSFIDLDTPLFLAEDPFEGGYVQEGETLRVDGIAAGHGLVPAPRAPSGRGAREGLDPGSSPLGC